MASSIWWDLKTGKALRVIRKHRLAIWSVAFAPDGKTVASGGDDGDAKIWNIITGELRCDLVGHTACVHSISFSADQTAVVTTGGYTDTTMKVWDARTGKLRRSFQFPQKRQYVTHKAALYPDGGTAVVGTSDKPLRFFRIASGEELEPLEGHADCFASVVISRDGKTLASGGGNDDKTIRVWDLETRHLRWVLKGHTDSIPSVSLSADGKRLASGSLDNTARVWNLETGKEIAVLKGHTSTVRSVALSPDGKTVVTVGDDDRIKIWDADTGREWTGPAGEHLVKIRNRCRFKSEIGVAPTGSVTFVQNNNPVQTDQFTLGTGQSTALYTPTYTAPGNAYIYAVYNPDPGFVGSIVRYAGA